MLLKFVNKIKDIVYTQELRSSSLASYQEHYILAASYAYDETPGKFLPWNTGEALYGVLKEHFEETGTVPSRDRILSELMPFFLMDSSIAPKALAEYIVFKEKPCEAHIKWLRKEINKAFQNISSLEEFSKDIFSNLIMYPIPWFKLITPQTKEIIINMIPWEC